MDFEFPAEFSKEATSRSFAADSVAEVKDLNNIVNDKANLGFYPSEFASDQTSMQKEPLHGQDVSTNHSESDQKETNTAMGTARTSEDGYNWRKYGQKVVKGNPNPRYQTLSAVSLSCSIKLLLHVKLNESSKDAGINFMFMLQACTFLLVL